MPLDQILRRLLLRGQDHSPKGPHRRLLLDKSRLAKAAESQFNDEQQGRLHGQ